VLSEHFGETLGGSWGGELYANRIDRLGTDMGHGKTLL
jgi:hypothetical protein